MGNILSGRSGEHGEVAAETVGVAADRSNLTFFLGVVLGIQPVGADLGGVHEDIVYR